jgi:DNA-directed RNA polymerase specialized sigma24 family protein
MHGTFMHYFVIHKNLQDVADSLSHRFCNLYQTRFKTSSEKIISTFKGDILPDSDTLLWNTMETEVLIPETRTNLFMELYQRTFPKVAAFIHKSGGNLDEAKDIFQDALVIYYEKTRDESFQPEVNAEAYLTGICKFLWFKKHKIKSRLPETELPFELHLEDETEPTVSEKLVQFVAHAGKKCLELLRAFYYDKKSMSEIADQFEFSGERSATAQKFKCLEKVRNTIKEKSLNPDDFYA